MQKFEYQEADIVGEKTLQTISAAHRFNRWMYDTVAAHIQPGNILEIGSGIGNISQYFLEANSSIMLSDIRDQYCQALRARFADHSRLLGVSKIDLVSPQFSDTYESLIGYFDNLYALNVIEHIEDDTLAIHNCKQLLKPKGKLIILVPAYPILYNQFDIQLGHYRRYTKKSLNKLMLDNRLQIERTFSFNLAGILGWFVSGKLMGKKMIPEGSMKLYNQLVPLFKIADRMVGRKIGLSVVVVASKA